MAPRFATRPPELSVSVSDVSVGFSVSSPCQPKSLGRQRWFSLGRGRETEAVSPHSGEQEDQGEQDGRSNSQPASSAEYENSSDGLQPGTPPAAVGGAATGSNSEERELEDKALLLPSPAHAAACGQGQELAAEPVAAAAAEADGLAVGAAAAEEEGGLAVTAAAAEKEEGPAMAAAPAEEDGGSAGSAAAAEKAGSAQAAASCAAAPQKDIDSSRMQEPAAVGSKVEDDAALVQRPSMLWAVVTTGFAWAQALALLPIASAIACRLLLQSAAGSEQARLARQGRRNMRSEVGKKHKQAAGLQKAAVEEEASWVQAQLRAAQMELADMRRRKEAAEHLAARLQQELEASQQQAQRRQRRCTTLQEEEEGMEDRLLQATLRVEELEGQLWEGQAALAELQRQLSAALDITDGTGGSGSAAAVAEQSQGLGGHGPGAAAVATLQRMLATSSGLDVGFGLPEVEAELEWLFQLLQLAAAQPCWETARVQGWVEDRLRDHGLQLTATPDTGVLRMMLQHILLCQLNERVFIGWHSWAEHILGCPLVKYLHTATAEASHQGHFSTLVYESAAMVHVSRLCRHWLGGDKPLDDAITNGLASDVQRYLQAAIRHHHPLGHENAALEAAIGACVQACIRLWVLLKACHPLLQPCISHVGMAVHGASVVRRVPAARVVVAGDEQDVLAAGEAGGCEVVLASLCPAATFVGSSVGAGAVQEVLVPERVASACAP